MLIFIFISSFFIIFSTPLNEVFGQPYDAAQNPSSNVHHHHHKHKNHTTHYEKVRIEDPAEDGSAGIYFRVSQKGIDYLADLASKGLPEILYRMALPTIKESGFVLSDAVITKLERPHIWVKFVPDYGIDLSIGLPELSVTGGTSLNFFFATYNAEMLAVLSNLTVQMRVHIHRDLSEDHTSVEVSNCTVNPGNFSMKFYGSEASEFYAIGDLIRAGIGDAIRDKICTLPPLVQEFIHQKIQLASQPPSSVESAETTTTTTSSSVGNGNRPPPPNMFDHLCSMGGQSKPNGGSSTAESGNSNSGEGGPPEVDLAVLNGIWLPDLTLRYPPKFSRRDLIFGIDGGFMYNGQPPPPSVERPKFDDIEVRDQMLGLILSEYVPNTFFYHIFNAGLGQVSVSYSHRHVPRVIRSMVKLACSDCRLSINANLTTAPKALVDRNGITLVLEGDVGAHFLRKNRTYNILSASGQLRVGIKPHFRHSRLYSDVLLAGVDFKVYRAGMEGLVAGAVRKLISFLIPRAIWPKIQQRLRLVVNHKGIQIPRLCSVELNHLHLDYIHHAAIISADFDVDLPLLISSFKQFMDQKQRSIKTRRELSTQFRYF